MRHPVVISSLEEDFKAIGILDEDQTDTTGGDAEGGKELEEVKKARTKRHGAADRRKWRMAKKKGKAKAASRKYRRKGSVKRMLKKHRMKAAKLRKGKPAGRMRLVFGDETVANLLEQVQVALSNAGGGAELDESKVQNAIKSFANLAIIAEMLGDFFTACVEEAEESDDVSDLAEAAEFFTDMSESAASIASALNEGKNELSFEEIEEAFQEQMAALVDGLEMYADLTEEDDCDDDDDDDDDDDEEDDDEDMDESVTSDSVAARMEAVKADMKKNLGKGQ